jgi:RimJ/RimL family protein N-acetyltransferase
MVIPPVNTIKGGDKMENIYTDRLLLCPITFAMTENLLEQKTEELARLGLFTDGSWPTADTLDILPIIYETLRTAPPSGFETWLIVKQADRKVIGDIGFHGRPTASGEAEIGYAIIDTEQGRGFGSEALKAMVAWVRRQANVKVLRAECLINNIASARMLKKAGFCEVKRDNELIYWVLS